VKMAGDGGVIAVYVPLRYLIAYSAEGVRLWLYDAMLNTILSWSLSVDGRLAAVMEGFLSGTASHLGELAIYELKLLESGSTVWAKTLGVSVLSGVGVAVSPSGRFIAVAWPAKDGTKLGVFSKGGDILWSIDLGRGGGSDHIYDLGVSDESRVVVCCGSRVVSVADGRVLWIKQFPDKQFSCRVSRSSSAVIARSGGKTHMIDGEGRILWAVDYEADRFDVSDNNYAVLSSGNIVTVISPRGEVVRREELKERARYVKISPKGRFYTAITENHIYIFKNMSQT